MAVLEGGVSATLAGVGAESANPLHVVCKPDPAGALGSYRTSHRCLFANSQAANSRLFSIQNAHATNLVVVHSVRVTWLQTGAHTAAIESSVDMYKCTSYSVVDTTNTVTPAVTKMRSSYAAPGANVRGLTVAGNSAGMTGGTLTKDANPIFQLPQWLLLAQPTTPIVPVAWRWTADTADGETPLILVQNEGFIIENRVVLGAAAASTFYVDVLWSELTAY